MLIIPAIDLLDGHAVRLLKGDYAKATVYAEDPVALARELEASGVRRLHLVDLDAARGKGRDNRRIIAEIRASVSCELELGGGVRALEDVEALLDLGMDALIIGTALVKAPDSVASWIARFPGRFVAGIDAREGKVKVAGWESDGAVSDLDLSRSAASMGFSAIIYTNIERDGTLEGPDAARSAEIAAFSGLPVIVSGGIGGEEHIHSLVSSKFDGLVGVIVGKAYYEGRIDLVSLCRLYPQDPEGLKARKVRR